MSSKFEYYDWQRTLSYDAEVTMVVTARGRGKTYGIRLRAVKDALMHGTPFVEICRYQTELAGMMRGYFDRLQADGHFTDWTFRTQGGEAFATKDAPETKHKKWIRVGYFVSLSSQQSLKKHTFSNVRRIIFDEVILDSNDKMHRYLPNEFNVFVNLVDTITRQRPGEKTQARVYLLGNSVDLVNPYFRRFGVTSAPKPGYTWYNHKHFLLHYEQDDAWGEARAEDTMVGHMLIGEEAQRSLFNSFEIDEQWIDNKTSDAVFTFGLRYAGESFGIWGDFKHDLLYVNRQIPRDAEDVYSLTLSDQTVDFNVLDRSSKRMKAVVNIATRGLIRYSDGACLQMFREILTLYGLHL